LLVYYLDMRLTWCTTLIRCALVTICLAIMFAGSPAFAQNLPSTAWQATASVNLIIEERSFASLGVSLNGTLYIPRAKKPVPAIVVLHSASSPTRDLPLYRHLIEMLPPLGIGVFLYDRRGSGKSGGNLATSDYSILADDAIAAQQMLAKDPRIDRRRTGFWGLSQGGWLALLAATRSSLTAFAVSVSAPLTPPDVQMNFAVANILRIRGFSEDDVTQAVAARTAIDDFMRGQRDRASTQAILDQAATHPWFEHAYLERTFSDPTESRWAKEIRHDPLETIARVKVPALILFGTDDPWVPVQISVERFRARITRRRNLTMHMVKGANHEMATTISLKDEIDPALFPRHCPDSPEYFGLLAAWLTRHVLAADGSR
jgi:dipeptidyl aminopeptidase/acylaminoacyl peptidase